MVSWARRLWVRAKAITSKAQRNNDYRVSDYTIKPGSPAENSGKPLPEDVAKEVIDPSGQTVRSGTPVNRGILLNPMMNVNR